MQPTREVTLSFNNGEYVFTLYVTPENITVTRPQNTKKYITVAGEELNLSAGKGLRQVSIQTFLPRTELYSRTATYYSPGEIISMLKRWQDTRKPMRLVISDTDINDAFLIEDLRQIFKEGDSDIYIDLRLCEYRFVSSEIMISSESDPNLGGRTEATIVPQTHVVVKGDTLWAISKRYYGTPLRWKYLQDKNNIADVYKLQIGTVIYL